MTTRAQLVSEAESWIGTKYEMNQGCKGAGTDCGRFIFQSLKNCGLVPASTASNIIETFGHDWSCHTDDDKYQGYIFRMLRHARKIAVGIGYPTLHALPGTIALTRTYQARVMDHGGIVVRWPQIIHAVPPKVERADASQHWLWSGKIIEVYDPFGEGDAT